jgi:hypothetical protein
MGAETGGQTANSEQTFDTETLRGDIRDVVLAEFKHIGKPWQKMNEEEQQRLINRAADIADKLVRQAVDLIAARDLPALPIEVGKIEVSGAECKGRFECYADDENLLRIRHLQGSRAMFVLASPSAYQGERAPQTPDVVGDLSMPKGPDTNAILDVMAADGHDIPDDARELPHNKARRANGSAEATA